MSLAFDPVRGLAVTADDPTLLRRVAQSLADDLGKRIAALQQALAANDLPEVHRHAHRNKGSCLTVGALALGERFSAIDQAARTNQGDEARRLGQDLAQMVAEFQAALAAWKG